MNKKCAIGATVLTPLVLTLIAMVLSGTVWFLQHFLIIGVIVQGLFILAAVGLVWVVLYEHCQDRKGRKE